MSHSRCLDFCNHVVFGAGSEGVVFHLHLGVGIFREDSQRPVGLGQCAVAQEVKKVFAHAASCLHPKDETFGARAWSKRFVVFHLFLYARVL